MCIRDRETPQRLHIRGIDNQVVGEVAANIRKLRKPEPYKGCLLYTSDAADERSSVDLGGRRLIKKKNRGKET